MADNKLKYCPKGLQLEAEKTTRERSFFQDAAKIAKLEVLNDVGGGKIRQTLETAVATSNAFRTGGGGGKLGALGRSAFNTVDGGANSLLESMGLTEGVRASVGTFQPQVVNLAVGSAKILSEDIRNGNFKLTDIPTRITDFNNLEALVRNIFRRPDKDTTGDVYNRYQCRPSPFAVDLVTRFSPKQNFSFIVDIKLHPAFIEHFADAEPRFKDIERGLAFMVKSTSRPHINYEYEDVNYYNFRSKVIQKQSYQPINMRFMDDAQNTAAKFYAMYSREMSPLNNRQKGNYDNLEETGMNFRRDGNFGIQSQVSRDSSSIGPLRSTKAGGYDTTSIIKEINIYHIANFGATFTVYSMFNPRITSLQPSELTMEESGNGAEFMFDFEYDALHVDPDMHISEIGGDRIRQLTGDGAEGGIGGEYPLTPISRPNPAKTSAGGTVIDNAINGASDFLDGTKNKVNPIPNVGSGFERSTR